MRTWTHAAGLAAACLCLGIPIASAQQVRATPADVAQPGGKIADASKLALAKVADGFHDPVGVTAANDASGRVFVVEGAGRVRVVDKSGKVLPEPFIDLTNFNRLGSDVQTGFVEQGLWSIAFHPKFKDNGYVFVDYTSLPFNGASIIARITVDPTRDQMPIRSARSGAPCRPTRFPPAPNLLRRSEGSEPDAKG